MEWVELYLGLGTNVGDRDVNLLRAMNALDQVFGTHPERISRIVETPAWGFEGPDFLNMCVLYRLPRQGTPEQHATQILHQVKEIEKAMGRTEEALLNEAGERVYHNRIIDIDILLYGTQSIHTEELTVPHPLIGERDFVKKPLKEIAGTAIKAALADIMDISYL